jgi:hypothetical protein
MLDDKDTGRDRLDLLPRDAWSEPWASMDTGDAPVRPDDLPDPEANDRPRLLPVLVLDRRNELQPIVAALEGFAAELRDVQQVWEAKQPPAPTDTRKRYGFSLGAVIALTRLAFPDEPDLAAAYEALLHDLSEVESMRPVEAFTPLPVGGNPGSTTLSIATMRGRYAATVELLHRQGRLIREAARDVRRAIPNGSPVWGNATPSWQAVKTWRDRDVKVAGSAEREAYEAGLALAERIGADAAIAGMLRRVPQVGR